MPAGRPKEWTDEKIIEVGKGLLEWMHESDDNIFIISYLSKYGIHKQRLSEWTSKVPEFSELVKEARQIQEAKLVQQASKQKINPVFTIFLLKNMHNYADKQEIKSDNLNRNVDAKDLLAKGEDDLKEALRTLSEETE